MISYLLHSSILVAGSFLFYWFLLRRETFYRLNRWVLLSLVFLSVLLPMLVIPSSWSLRVSPFNVLQPQSARVIQESKSKPIGKLKTTEGVKRNGEFSSRMSFSRILIAVYLIGIGIFLSAFLIQLLVLLRKSSKLEFIQDKKYIIYELTDKSPPFSFFRWIFINPSLYDPETYAQILEHEKIHVSQKHFIDKLFAEFGVVILWFNPFMWGLRAAIANNLEFLTDEEVLRTGVDSETYQINMLKVAVPKHSLDLTTNYNQSILRRRITMMNSKKSSARSSWKYIVVFPLLLFSVVSLNATYLPEDVLTNENDSAASSNRKEYREVITKTLRFKNSSSENLLMVANITGKIDVEGYSGDEVRMEVTKVVTANNDLELQRGVKETNFRIIESDREIYIYLDSPYSRFDQKTAAFSYRNACGRKSCIDYGFELHYSIKVPYKTNLRLSTVNGGDIQVADVIGSELSVEHVSGSIDMRNIAGVTDAKTISGGIKATYNKNPDGESSYETISGHIKVTYVENLNATVSYYAKDGRLVSDFDIFNDSQKSHKHWDKTRSPVRIGSGGTKLNFKTISGNIYINKK